MFGVVAYLVEQRRYEIGVRIALGARASDVVALMLRGTVAVTAAGASSASVSRSPPDHLVAPLLFDTSVHDPATIIGVGALPLGVATVAAGVPGARERDKWIRSWRCARKIHTSVILSEAKDPCAAEETVDASARSSMSSSIRVAGTRERERYCRIQPGIFAAFCPVGVVSARSRSLGRSQLRLAWLVSARASFEKSLGGRK